jgi:AraC family transcriptional regulator, regulatory protein of adaptative response / methylated-DNA-[protein]-cysteine methyltransferase
MTLSSTFLAEAAPSVESADYATVKKAIAFVSQHWRAQPDVEEIADAVGLSAAQVTQLFRRWAGLTPKAFCQAITLDHARRLLKDSTNILDASLELGLSGPGRLHDLFVTHEAMSPGEYATGGAGLTLRYGFHASPFGEALLVITDRGLAALGWVDDKAAPGTAATDGKPAGGRKGALDDMMRRWPRAKLVQDQATTAPFGRRIFEPADWRKDTPLRVVLIGTDFEIRVWETLLRIPLGAATTYGDVAGAIGKPGGARAVGAAVGRNPVSFVVPCHRVMGKSGALTGYHWGLTRKQAILGWEAGIAG